VLIALKPTPNRYTFKKQRMNFSQKIYFNDIPLILTTGKEAYIKANDGAQAFTAFSGSSQQIFKDAIQHLEMPGSKGVIIAGDSVENLLARLSTMFHPIDAAGGVAYNETGDILVIFRRGKWDLPKGKLDDGEKIEECALREVSEETGLQQLTLDGKICDTYHIYTQKKDQILKRTAWYKMKGSSTDKLMPQKDEGILEAKWIREKDLAPYAAGSYEAVREVLRTAGLKW
jgi:ADP-ribose pyrophosphatase YjhB (NUDIX family)